MQFNRHDYTYEILQEKIPEDEPVFLLRGQDVMAPGVIDIWADRVESAGGQPGRIIAASARRQAEAMREWQRKHKGKVPDIPPVAGSTAQVDPQ